MGPDSVLPFEDVTCCSYQVFVAKEMISSLAVYLDLEVIVFGRRISWVQPTLFVVSPFSIRLRP
jgi:hypothetical protein